MPVVGGSSDYAWPRRFSQAMAPGTAFNAAMRAQRGRLCFLHCDSPSMDVR